ncbi:MAG: nucleotidyltransferase family protein [Acidobacteriaceae bacterium]|nr:nucleotidyltransferase family protein [Acidobacteriaceae bacterium]
MSGIIELLAAAKSPPHIAAALELLQFQSTPEGRVCSLSETEQQRFLRWCDDRQLTLMLSHVAKTRLPGWLRDSIAAKADRYELRFERIKRELFQIVAALNGVNLPFLMLKGLSHSPALTPDPRLRAQGDIDLWLPESSIEKGRRILSNLGYVSLLGAKSRHLPPMTPQSNWKWRGDLYDPEMPISVELHYELWSERTEYIRAPGLDQFWDRSVPREFDGHSIQVLCDEDLLGFAALHVLLHLLHGELPLQRAWEIARFLDIHVADEVFWRRWRRSHPAALRQLEVCIFRLVAAWFGCRWREDFDSDVQSLPFMARSWLDKCPLKPVEREWKANKSEVSLHLALINNPLYEICVLLRRLVPISLPFFVDEGASRPQWRMRLARFRRQLPLFVRRFVLHAVTFLPTLFNGLCWFWTRISQAHRP